MNRVTVHDAATGETYERDATPEELAFYEQLAADMAAQNQDTAE